MLPSCVQIFRQNYGFFFKLWYNSLPTCPNELKLIGCTWGDVGVVPTHFEIILKKSNFL